jgi:hypothetical protein
MHDIHSDGQKFNIGPEFIPRFAQFLPNSLVVAEGETVVIDGDVEYAAIENHGTIRFSREADITLRFRHFFNAMTGVVDCGTAEDPITRNVVWEVIDAPLDAQHDPYQWGNGILNAGHMSRVGVYKTPFVEIEPALQGATTLTLRGPVVGWGVGDELLLPDTRYAHYSLGAPRQESPVFITSIDGNTVKLSSPLGFDHLAVTRPDGSVAAHPSVANMTRNIVVRSENPFGTRGHSANVGHMASWHVEGNAFKGIGRTTFGRLHNTTIDAAGVVTNGTNQIGKYTDHMHHCWSRPDLTRITRANSYNGTERSKWAVVAHGTYDVTIEDCVAVDMQGAAFVTEDGYEDRVTFRGNVAAFTVGNRMEGADSTDPAIGNAPGGDGAGFWFRSCRVTVVGNQSWNNRSGYSVFNMFPVGVGAMQGGRLYTAEDAAAAVPYEWADNVSLGNAIAGMEMWTVNHFHIQRQRALNDGQRGIWPVVFGAPNPSVIATGVQIISGEHAVAIESASAYTPTLNINGGEIRGCGWTFGPGVVRGSARLHGDLVLQNHIGMELDASTTDVHVAASVRFEAMPGVTNPKHIVVAAGSDTVWAPGEGVASAWRFAGVPQVKVVLDQWNGEAGPFRLALPQQRGDSPLWPATADQLVGTPEAGLTVGQVFERYGYLPVGGYVSLNGEALHGMHNVVADRTPLVLPPPSAVVTYPNMNAPHTAEWLDIAVALTGDPAGATTQTSVSVDGGPVEHGWASAPEMISRHRVWDRASSAYQEGTHTIRVWRSDAAYNPVPGSERTFQYFRGAATPGGDPVDCVLGDWRDVSRTEGPWVIDGDTKSRVITTEQQRDILTAPANGGAACGPTTRTVTATETAPIAWRDATVQMSDDGRVRVCVDGTCRIVA